MARLFNTVAAGAGSQSLRADCYPEGIINLAIFEKNQENGGKLEYKDSVPYMSTELCNVWMVSTLFLPVKSPFDH